MPTEPQVAQAGRALDDAKWELPKQFRLQADLLSLPPDELKERDPDMYALWIRVQDQERKLRERFAGNPNRMSPQDMHRARAVQRAEELRSAISEVQTEIHRIAIAGDASPERTAELERALWALKHRRAEHLSLSGRYDLAIREEIDPQYREHYEKILAAVLRDDNEMCECPDHYGGGEHSNIRASSLYVAAEVFSIKHGGIRPLIACRSCGHLNVREMPTHLRELRRHRQRAHALAKDAKTPTEAAAILTANKHTAAHLLK